MNKEQLKSILAKQIRLIVFLVIIPVIFVALIISFAGGKHCESGYIEKKDEYNYLQACYLQTEKDRYMNVLKECLKLFPLPSDRIVSPYSNLTFDSCKKRYFDPNKFLNISNLEPYEIEPISNRDKFKINGSDYLDEITIPLLFLYPAYLIFILLRWAFKTK